MLTFLTQEPGTCFGKKQSKQSDCPNWLYLHVTLRKHGCREDTGHKNSLLVFAHTNAETVLLAVQPFQRKYINLFNERKTVNRVENYFEITIPQYEPDDFRSHFRLTRQSFDDLAQKISKCNEYNKKSDPPVDPVKDTLMFLWYIGMSLHSPCTCIKEHLFH